MSYPSTRVHYPPRALLREDRKTEMARTAVLTGKPAAGSGEAGHGFLLGVPSATSSSLRFSSAESTTSSESVLPSPFGDYGRRHDDSSGSMTSVSPHEDSSRDASPKPPAARSRRNNNNNAGTAPRVTFGGVREYTLPSEPPAVLSSSASDLALPLDKFRNKRPKRKLTKPRPPSPGPGRRGSVHSSSSSDENPIPELESRPAERLRQGRDQQVPDEHRGLRGADPDSAVEPSGTPSVAETALKNARAEVQRLNDELQRVGKRKVFVQKWAVTGLLVCMNFMLVFATWWWPKYYYAYLPFISLPLVLNCSMIASVTVISLYRLVFRRRRGGAGQKRGPDPEAFPGTFPGAHSGTFPGAATTTTTTITTAATPPTSASPLESFVMVMPCYNETLEECTRSLDSLIAQEDIENHPRAIMVICDGRVRGPGMDKTTAEYLQQDILIGGDVEREAVRDAYTAWDGASMHVDVSRGTYKGVPFYCIVKQQNQGKRDSLIVIRSFLHKFNQRGAVPPPASIFSKRFFGSMSGWLATEARLASVDHLIGMDADTVFDPACIRELLEQSRDPHTVGVCGYVAVDFSLGNWNPWLLYQNAEYSVAQGLRRLHQSIATKKVSCLPGCCQLLRVCETTCGDLVLVDLFGYHPRPSDGMLRRIRATASEDRNHVCLMLTTFPRAQTRQALRARAYTDVPRSWSVFLSQRRRWTLGATSNDMLLVFARGTQWWERIVAFSNVLTWMLNVFVIASIGCMIVAFMSQPWWIIVAFASIMIVPILYYVLMAVWLPRTMLERAQYLLGLLGFVIIGPLINISVMFYAVWNMDSFGWGKTRQVIEDAGEKEQEGSAGCSDDGSASGPVSMTENELPAMQMQHEGGHVVPARQGQVGTANPGQCHC